MPLPAGYVSTIAARNDARVLVNPCVIIREDFTTPAAAVSNGLSASHAGAGTSGTTSQTLGGSLCSGGIGTLDAARNVVIVVTHGSAVVAMGGVITGTDKYGKTITEAWSVSAGTTSKTFTGKKAFKTITSITETVAADASANTIISGSGSVLGLGFQNECISLVKEVAAGSVVTNGVVTAKSSVSTADARGTYVPNTIPDGATSYTVFYIVQDFIHVK